MKHEDENIGRKQIMEDIIQQAGDFVFQPKDTI